MFKKYCISFLAFTLACLLLCAGVVFCVDPFNHYRADKDLAKIINQNPYYQNLGISKYSSYDTLITGSSMTQNFRANWFDDALNCHAVRLSFDGGYTPDYCSLLKTALENNKELKTIYFGLDNYVLTSDTSLVDNVTRIPSWQTDNNPLSDVNYLLNKDVLSTNIRIYLGYKFSSSYDFYEAHCWDNSTTPSDYDKERVLKSFKMSENQSMLSDSYFIEQANDFLDAVSPFIEENPQVQFVFFSPPYSILYWYDLLNSGKLNATISAMQYVYENLLKFDNVKLFFFQNNIEKITNLDMYKDFSHYHTDYNRWMLSEFQNTTYLLTKDTCFEVLEKMKNTVQTFDYEELLS